LSAEVIPRGHKNVPTLPGCYLGKKDGIEGADQNRRDRAGARIFRCFPAEKTVKAEAR